MPYAKTEAKYQNRNTNNNLEDLILRIATTYFVKDKDTRERMHLINMQNKGIRDN